MSGEYDTHNNMAFVEKLIVTVKNLRELLGRLSFDFDQDGIKKTKEILVYENSPEEYGGERIERGISFEIEDVGQNPVQKVCRLTYRRNDVLTIYSIVMHEHAHALAEGGRFSEIFLASTRLDEDNKPTAINGVVLPFVVEGNGIRLIPIGQQLDEDHKKARAEMSDLTKIDAIIKAVKDTLPPVKNEIGKTSMHLVKNDADERV